MSKTIEDAAREFAADVDKNVVELYGIENPPMSITFGECAADAFRKGAEYSLTHQWRSVEDELPELNIEVIVAYLLPIGETYVPVRTAGYLSDDGWIDATGEAPISPIFWMPYPEIPSLNPEQR